MRERIHRLVDGTRASIWARKHPEETREKARVILLDFFQTNRQVGNPTVSAEERVRLIEHGQVLIADLTALIHGTDYAAAGAMTTKSDMYQDEFRATGSIHARDVGMILGRVALINRERAKK